MLRSQRIPRELLVPRLCWNSEEVSSKICKGMSQQHNNNKWINELASESEGSQTRNKSFLFPHPSAWAATRRCGPVLGWVLPPQMTESRKPLTGMPSCWVFQLSPDAVKSRTEFDHHRGGHVKSDVWCFGCKFNTLAFFSFSSLFFAT